MRRTSIVVGTVLATTAVLVLCALVLMFSATPATARAASIWSDLSASALDSYGLKLDDVGAMSNGYPDGTWRPDELVTRGQFVVFALRYFGLLPADGLVQQHFSDVPPSSPHYGWVETAREVGLIQGYEVPSSTERTVFGLYDVITREQAVTILMRYLSKMDPSRFDYSKYTDERCQELLAPFSDKDQVRRAQEVAMALDIGVLRPAGAGLMSQANLTRIQAAALIARTQGVLPPPTGEPPTTDSHVLWWLTNDAWLLSIQVGFAQLGSAAPWMPRTLTLQAQVQAEQGPAVYEETAGILVSLAEQYKDQMKYEQVRIVLTTEGGAWVFDRTFQETPTVPAYPPMSSDPYSDFFSGFSGDGYYGFRMVAVHEGDTWIVRVLVRVDADKQTRATYDAIYGHATISAKEHGVATGVDERLRIVIVEATPIPPMGEPEQKVLEQRDFDLSGGAGLGTSWNVRVPAVVTMTRYGTRGEV